MGNDCCKAGPRPIKPNTHSAVALNGVCSPPSSIASPNEALSPIRPWSPQPPSEDNMASETPDNYCHSEIIKSALKTAQEQFPDKTFDQKTVQDIQKIAESTVNELSLTLHKIRKEKKIGEAALSHLTPERIKKIKKALEMKTFQVKIHKKEKKAEIQRNGKDMYPTMNLCSSGNLSEANAMQMASIVVEAIILVLEIIGINVPDDEKAIRNTIKLVLEDLRRDVKILKDIDQIRRDRDNFPAMAKDIFVLVIHSMHNNIFWRIVKALLSHMSWKQFALTSAQIAAFIGLSVSTDGLADIAWIVVKVTNAAFFIGKLANLETLSTMKSSLMAS